MPANNAQTNKEQPILALIQDIKDGRVAPETIEKDLRQQCIEVFLAEGYTTSSIAQIFKKNDRTIRRDIEDIRSRNAIAPDINLAKKTIGEMIVYARVHRDHLMRLARIKDASVAEKSQAEYLAARVGLELINKLQTLGFLPLKPQEIIADFSHHVSMDDEKSIEDLKMQLDEIEKLAMEQGGFTPELEIEVKKLKKRLEQAEIEKDVLKITDQQKKEKKND